MTLIELTVVLLVLIGLAGLMIPYVSGFVSKTHDSTGSFNSAAMDSNIQRYQGEKMRLPNNLEALVECSVPAGGAACDAAAASAIYTKMMAPGLLAPKVVGGAARMSLRMAGITDIYYNDASTDNATFRSTVALPTTYAATDLVAVVAPITAAAGSFPADLTVEEHMAAAFERNINNFDSACYDYVVMGIGDKSDLIGSTMNTAPVHFAQQGAMGPVNNYNRFVAVFQVDKINASGTPNAPGGLAANTTGDCSTNIEPAKFLGAAMAMGASSGHLWGTSHSLAHTYENIAAN